MSGITKPSQRGLANLESGAFIDIEDEFSHLPAYDPAKCPDGLIDLSGAVNTLMEDRMTEQVERFAAQYPIRQAIGYGPVMGPTSLADAIARFMTLKFKPAEPVQAAHVLVTNGVSSLLDLVAFNICDPGEGVMILTPTYMMLEHDLCSRAAVRLIPVPPNVEDQFAARCASQLVRTLEVAFVANQRRGIHVKALLICNPCNPVGRCYSKSTLIQLAKFCGRRQMHLISDEIYAMSGFTPLEPGLDDFTSVLSIPADPGNQVLAGNIHCVYGASKDFGAGGLRLGFFVTRNELLWKTCRRLALFTWVTPFSAAFFEHFLCDEDAMTEYLDLYRERLRDRYIHATGLLRKHGIPFDSANSGLFLLVRLTQWLRFFDSSHPSQSCEEQLCRYLAYDGGVFMSMGQLSRCEAPGCFRFVYAAGDPDMIALAIARLAVSLARLTATVPDSTASSEESSLYGDEEKGTSSPGRPTVFRVISRLLICSSET